MGWRSRARRVQFSSNCVVENGVATFVATKADANLVLDGGYVEGILMTIVTNSFNYNTFDRRW